MRADGLRDRFGIAIEERERDLAVIALVILPFHRVRMALLQLQPWSLMADRDDRVEDADGEAVMGRGDQPLMERAVEMLPGLEPLGLVAGLDAFHDGPQ